MAANGCPFLVPLRLRSFGGRRAHFTDLGAHVGAAAHLKGLSVEEAIMLLTMRL